MSAMKQTIQLGYWSRRDRNSSLLKTLTKDTSRECKIMTVPILLGKKYIKNRITLPGETPSFFFCESKNDRHNRLDVGFVVDVSLGTSLGG